VRPDEKNCRIYYASLCQKHFQERTAETADLSTPLRSVEMTKGKVVIAPAAET
jgi:hypothetical protein